MKYEKYVIFLALLLLLPLANATVTVISGSELQPNSSVEAFYNITTDMIVDAVEIDGAQAKVIFVNPAADYEFCYLSIDISQGNELCSGPGSANCTLPALVDNKSISCTIQPAASGDGSHGGNGGKRTTTTVKGELAAEGAEEEAEKKWEIPWNYIAIIVIVIMVAAIILFYIFGR